MHARRTLWLSLHTLALLCCATASAGLGLDPGVYRLSDSRSGSPLPATAGLRLAGLDGDPSHEFQFRFDAEGSAVDLILDPDGSLSIEGRVVGGRDAGGALIDPQLWSLEFVYSQMISVGSLLVSAPGAGGAGTLTPTADIGGFDAGREFALSDDANHEFSFYLIDDYPSFSGVTGIGWLVRSGEAVSEADRHPEWLFSFRRRIEPAIPEPGAALLFAGGLLLFAAGFRARPH